MEKIVFDLNEVDKDMIALVGGKAAGLGTLASISGINVPPGFCISTRAYKKILADSLPVRRLIEILSSMAPDDENIAPVSAEIREAIRNTTIPPETISEIDRFLVSHPALSYAVRSSATAEDLPAASFAGQQDSYMDIRDKDSVLEHVRLCWASLFTDRAVRYRMQNHFDHRHVYIAVIVQEMIHADVSAVIFTADPVTGHRKELCIDAAYGPGERLVSGRLNPDRYKVTGNEILEKVIAPGAHAQVLSPDLILRLAALGKKIEAHLGFPQDIECCLAGGEFYFVQSRPITTLYPVPVVDDEEKHVYVSVGHQQMMTDPMRPLGLAFFMRTAFRPMFAAGGRLFVDVAAQLRSAEGRDILINFLGKSDPLVKAALETIIDRGDFPLLPENDQGESRSWNKSMQAGNIGDGLEKDPSVIGELIAASRESLAVLQKQIGEKSGEAVLDFILADIAELQRLLFDPKGLDVIMTGINASAALNEKMSEWLGETGVADTISQSVPNNITSEMGLALLDLADAIRPHGEAIGYLSRAGHSFSLEKLKEVKDGEIVYAAIQGFLTRFGMRCAGEIDLTNTRWTEDPSVLIPVILSNVRNFEPGESRRKFSRGEVQALEKETDLLRRLEALPSAGEKIAETRRLIRLIRDFIGYREYPKFGKICRYFVYKQALLREADRLVEAGTIRNREDIFYLSLEELGSLLRERQPVSQLIARRRLEETQFRKLKPPRVMTSEGEIITARYDLSRLPPGAFAGLAVSSGIVEGRARIIFDIADAALQPGDILVTPFTDPGWTALFAGISGLVTEVGGLMTHGAVIAREYGLPAVVGMENATRLIPDGQRIRLNGTEGYVEIL